MTKTADNATVTAGSPIGFTMTVTNNGAGTATNATLSDALPTATGLSWSISPAYTGPGTCSIAGTPQVLTCAFGDLAPTASATVHVTSPTTGSTSGTISNTAVTRADNNPPTETTTTVTVNSPNLVVSKVADNATVSSGDPIGFTITVTNTGLGAATNAVLNDTLPTATGVSWTISPAYAGPGTCTISGTPQTLNCAFGSLAPTTSAMVHVTSPTTTATSGTLSNTAIAQADNNPPTSSTATVTVNQPVLTITKAADAAVVKPGQPIGYVVTVRNTGAGSATNVTVTDPLPGGPGISWSINPAVAGCQITGTAPNQTLNCTFASLAPTATVTIHLVSNTTNLSCVTLVNTATVGANNHASVSSSAVSITVDCKPNLVVTKVACPTPTTVPGALLTYTINYSNTGTAAANLAKLVDTLPAGTEVANAGGGSVAGAPGSQTVTWDLGTLAAGANGSKTLVVLVTAGNGATLLNSVTFSAANSPSVTSTTSTAVSNAGAITHGSAYGLDVDLLSLNLIHLGQVNTVAPGSPQAATRQLLNVGLLELATVSAVRQTSNSEVTNQAVSTSTSEVLDVDLLLGAIRADKVRAVSQSVATGTSASGNAAGSTYSNLRINGNLVTNVVPGVPIVVKNPLAPSQNLAEVMVLEEVKTATFANGRFTATHASNGLRVTLLRSFLGLAKGAQIIVAHADSDATYPSGLACGTVPATVSGKAFTAFAEGTFFGTPIATAQVGDATITPFGGTDSDIIAGVALAPAALSGTASNSATGSLTPNPNAQSRARVENANVLAGIVRADVLDVAASSTSNGTTASTTFTTTFANVRVQLPGVLVNLGANVAPNTTFAIPSGGGTILLILNEQIKGGNGTKDTEGTVNAIHAYILNGSNVVTAEVIVASAHSDAHRP